jgi:hypothetical protein
MNNTDNDMVRLLKKLRKRGVEPSLMRNGTIQFTNFERVSKHDNELIGLYYADIADYLKEQTPKAAAKSKPKPKPNLRKEEEEADFVMPKEWLMEDEAAAFTPLGSVVIRPSPLSSIALRATFSGIVQEKVAKRVGK